MLVNADEIVIVAAPDLANLRNTKNTLDMLRSARAHDGHPKLIMNCSKRPEISVNDFAKAVDLVPSGIVPFAPKLFGPAANNGQMIAEVEGAGKLTGIITDLARKITGRNEPRKAKRILDPLMLRFGRKQGAKTDPIALRGASPNQS